MMNPILPQVAKETPSLRDREADTIRAGFPVVGVVHVSTIDPSIRVIVEHVETIKADEYGAAAYIVEACEPGHAGDMSQPGYEFTGDEWAELGFIPEAGKASL